MITKAQALAAQAAYIASFSDRLDALIIQAAQNGLTSVTISYLPSSDAEATNYLNNVIKPSTGNGGGWASSTIDTVAKTITVAP